MAQPGELCRPVPTTSVCGDIVPTPWSDDQDACPRPDGTFGRMHEPEDLPSGGVKIQRSPVWPSCRSHGRASGWVVGSQSRQTAVQRAISNAVHHVATAGQRDKAARWSAFPLYRSGAGRTGDRGRQRGFESSDRLVSKPHPDLDELCHDRPAWIVARCTSTGTAHSIPNPPHPGAQQTATARWTRLSPVPPTSKSFLWQPPAGDLPRQAEKR